MHRYEGEVPQYYVENNHEAIISPQVFDWVKEEIKRRREGRGRYSGVSIFSGKIKCGECGGWFGAKVWHSTDKYRRVIYRCNNKFDSQLWASMVECITVSVNGSMTVVFRDRTEIKL